MRLAALVLSVLVGCVRTPALPLPRPAPPPPVAVAARTPGRYVALYDQLVARILAEHAFSPSYERVVGRSWAEEVKALRPEFANATTRDAVAAALDHLQASLRDEHCWYTPPADVHESRLTAGFGEFVEDAPDSRRVFVASPPREDLGPEVAVGDEIVALDGLSVDAWVLAHRFASNAIDPAKHRAAVVRRALRTRWAQDLERHAVAGTVTLLRAGARHDVPLTYVRRKPWVDALNVDRAPPVATFPCEEEPPTYGGTYALAAHGVNLCVYTAKDPARRAYPIVRWLSFMYHASESTDTFRQLRVEHDVLERTLRGAKGVVLDLRSNHGGQNPFVFLRWFAGKPYEHEMIRARVSPRVRTDQELDAIFYEDVDAIAAWRSAVTAKKETAEFRFLCSGSACAEVPLADDRVTTAPVAVLLGPECVSSCDTFALTFEAFGLGPLVGRQPALGFTANRETFTVKNPVDGEELGTMRLAISSSYLAALGDTESVEGRPRRLDRFVPHRFAERDREDALTVEAALQMLGPRP